jgi:hypothetical protein
MGAVHVEVGFVLTHDEPFSASASVESSAGCMPVPRVNPPICMTVFDGVVAPGGGGSRTELP